MGFLCTRSPVSLSISPFPSYGDLPRFGILGMSGSSSSHIATLASHLVSPLSPTSLFIFFYPLQSSSHFMNDVSFGVHHLLLAIVHLCVGRVALLTCFSDIWHCAHKGMELSIRYLTFVSHHFIHLSPLAYITVRVVRPP